MKEAGARCVIGIDPSPLFCCQFRCVKLLSDDTAVNQLPLRSDQLPKDLACFDTVVFNGGALPSSRSTGASE